MRAVRPIASVTIVGRDPANARALADELGAEVAGPEAVADADLVCTCTTSAEPLFDGALLAPGTHVNAIGAYRADLRELDDAAMRRATVVVETRALWLRGRRGDRRRPRRGRLIRSSATSSAAAPAGRPR